MPPNTDDRRVLIFAGAIVLLAGLAVMALLFLATGGTKETPDDNKPLFLGLKHELTKEINDASPLYFASPFGDNGFWLDVENGKIVALNIVRPGTKDCQVKWKESHDAYVDCDGQDLQAADLDRFQVTVGPLQKDAPADAVYVNLKVDEPAPVADPGE